MPTVAKAQRSSKPPRQKHRRRLRGVQRSSVGKQTIENFEMDEYRMRDAIKELKPSKLRDSRGVSKEIIKNIQNTIIPSLTKLGKLSLEANKVPICQKMVHIIGIPKGSGSDRL